MHLLSDQVLGRVTYREDQKVVLASSFLEKEALHWHVLYFIQAVYPEQTRHVKLYFNVDSRTYGRRKLAEMSGIR